MVEQNVSHFWTELHGEQQEVGNVFDVPFGECREYCRRYELLWPDRSDEWAIHFAALHLVQDEFAHSAIEMDARTYNVRIQQTDITAFF